jgi:hypothetical protein
LPATTCSTSAARTVSSIDASFTKPAGALTRLNLLSDQTLGQRPDRHAPDRAQPLACRNLGPARPSSSQHGGAPAVDFRDFQLLEGQGGCLRALGVLRFGYPD